MTIVVVGASLAGLRAVQELRRAGHDGAIIWAGDERHRPYDRPPLSKQVLAGEWPVERATLIDDEQLEELAVELRLGCGARSLRAAERTVDLDGDDVGFDGLVIATGARPRRLPVPTPPGVHLLRTRDDTEAIGADLAGGVRRVVVIGAGFIGAEVAATCRGAGHHVTMVDFDDVPMRRGLGAELGAEMAELHRSHGVDLRLGVGVEGFEGTDRVTAVNLSDESTVAADVVVVGVGVTPNTEWLEGSGLTLDNGVVCDETLLAAPAITAAGDVARWPNPVYGEMMRVEHWDNAGAQGAAAARRLLVDEAEAEPFAAVPYFWSDQYDRKIQVVGSTAEADEMQVVERDDDAGRLVALYRRGDRLAAVAGVNRPRAVILSRSSIEEGITFADALAARS